MASSRGGNRALNALIANLKRAKPASVVSVAADETETTVALTGQRGRYERVARSLISLGAVTARCMDGDGAVSEVIAVGEAEPELGEDGGRGAKPRDVPGEVERLVRIALDARDRDRGRDLEMMSSVVDASVAVLKTASERAERLEATLMRLSARRERELGDRADDLKALIAQGASGASEDDSKLDQLVDKVIDLAMGGKGGGNGAPTFTTAKKKREAQA